MVSGILSRESLVPSQAKLTPGTLSVNGTKALELTKVDYLIVLLWFNL